MYKFHLSHNFLFLVYTLLFPSKNKNARKSFVREEQLKIISHLKYSIEKTMQGKKRWMKWINNTKHWKNIWKKKWDTKIYGSCTSHEFAIVVWDREEKHIDDRGSKNIIMTNNYQYVETVIIRWVVSQVDELY